MVVKHSNCELSLKGPIQVGFGSMQDKIIFIGKAISLPSWGETLDNFKYKNGSGRSPLP